MIFENMVFKYMDEKGETIRVIFIDQLNDLLFYINMDLELGTPKCDSLNKINEEVENNILVKLVDPYFKNIDENRLSDIQKQKRDGFWDIIRDIWENRKLEILEVKTRNKVMEDVSIDRGVPVITIRRILSRFWQRGMTKNALLPDYKNSGGKGKQRNLADIKVGRPKNVDLNGDVIIGINITEDIKKQFDMALNKYNRNCNKISLKETYYYILRDFFSNIIIENGKRKFIVWGEDRIPTYDQFYYWFKKNEDPKKDIIFREGITEFNLKNRPLLSNSTIETDGPGTRFQVDATIADIYIVSSLDRNRVIGRPIVYAIIDVFSRLVTGIYVGLEGPSWIGAMMALDNMVADKVEFCSSFGINITEEQWPANHLPDILIADNGEFEGYSDEKLINNLNVKVENTTSYRGDLKGIVERNFRTVNEKIKHMTPGAIQKEFRKRGDEDYRLKSTLSLVEFTKIFINLVLLHNNKISDKYPVEKEMLIDNLPPIPSLLWNWGIQNKKGRLRIVDREVLRLNVLPRGNASISRSGIRFEGLYYGSKKALEEQWFIKSKVRSIEIAYDPRKMNNIYIIHDDGKTFDTCYLLEPSKQYKDIILEEIIYNFELISEIKETQKNQQNQLEININNEVEKIVKEAKIEKTKEFDYSQSSNKKLKGIKNNRIVEKEINRVDEAFKLGEDKINSDKVDNVIEISNFNKVLDKKEDEGKDRIMEMLKKKRDDRREK